MKDKIQIALLSVIAVALVALAVKQFSGDPGSNNNTSTVAATKTASSTPPVESFDPMANNTAPVDNTPKTTINFAEYEHAFGDIKQDSENKHIFKFTNTGTEPLIIESATGSCGCTVPNYPKAPIPPGGTGDIEVVYKPGKQENAQNKTVTVVANTEPKETTLRISANVQKI
ncbi:MAG: DUF1573 domain-containing protein [Flavobacteriales bacterium]|jgi:hypothetical protein|nr:DUF1573 domain-containing protein [Flavobacteriales bacterium]